jgi:hypothetical protein
MYDKWYLKDWDLKLISTLIIGGNLRQYGDGYKLTFGYLKDDPLSNTSFMIFDNGGELNIFGLGFEANNQAFSMPLPVDGPYKFSNEDVVSYRLMQWIKGEEIDITWESVIELDVMEALK